jgi:gliding motility-associated-like protein
LLIRWRISILLKNRNPTTVLLVLYLLLLHLRPLHAQLPKLQWGNKYGGSAVEIANRIILTQEGGTAICGYTTSKDGDVKAMSPRDYWDLWVVKLDKCGNLLWEKSFGGTGYESARDMLQTPDGGYLVLGETNSTDGGVVSGYGGTKDIWLLKLSSTGNLEWQKRYGGTGLDIGNRIKMMPDGNYLIAATTASFDGDIKQNRSAKGYTDGALLRIDAAGNLLWTSCYGGSRNEELLDFEIFNNKIYAAGYANSIDGDIPPSQKNYDVWVIALDMLGHKVYSKVYGGSQNDVAYSIVLGADNSLTLGGYTTSSDGLASGWHGSQDGWVINIKTDGSFNWQKSLGGKEADFINQVIADGDGYLAGGVSYSEDGDITGAKGEGDFWVVKLKADGSLAWSRNYGGDGADNLHALVKNGTLNEYYLAGDADSYDGDFSFSGSQETDAAVIKFKDPEISTKDSLVCDTSAFVPIADTLKDICGFDSVILSYKPVKPVALFDGIQKSDTIFEGESLQLPASKYSPIVWSAHPTLSCTACQQPIANPLITTSYTANITLDQCMVSEQFTLIVLKEAVLFLPNAFSPNGDGKNDSFGPIGKVPHEFSMLIYNRFGEMVFKSNNTESRWNGRLRGAMQPSGSFTYTVQYRDTKQQIQYRKGIILLLH